MTRAHPSTWLFPARKATRLLIWTAVIVGIVTLTTLPAFADADGGHGVLAAFDVKDSRGIYVSQYELSINTGGVSNPLLLFAAQTLNAGWNFYRGILGMCAWLVDWTVSMSWLSLITDPMRGVLVALRSALVTPLGLVGFMLTVAAAVGGFRLMYGRTGKGLFDIISAAVVAALVGILLGNPLNLTTGDPLTKARNVGVGVADLIVNGESLAESDVESKDPTPELNAGSLIVDSLIRPAHGVLNYGTAFTAETPCVEEYEAALKEGPYWTPSSDKTREAVAACDKAMGRNAEIAAFMNSMPIKIVVLGGLIIGAMLILSCFFFYYSILQLAWTSLRLVFTGILGIGPGAARGMLLRDACLVIACIAYVVIGLVVLAIQLRIMREILSGDGGFLLQMLITDLVAVVGAVMVVQTWRAHRQGAESWAEKLTGWMKQSTPRPTVGDRVGTWMRSPVGGDASRYGPLAAGGGGLGQPGDSGGGGGQNRMGVGAMLRPVTRSNAFQVARVAGLAAATGGAGAIAGVTGAARAANTGYQASRTMQRTYRATQVGATRATTGNKTVDAAVHNTVRAQNWLRGQRVNAEEKSHQVVGRGRQWVGRQAAGAATRLAALTPSNSHQTPAQDQTHTQREDRHHEKQRRAAEHQLKENAATAPVRPPSSRTTPPSGPPGTAAGSPKPPTETRDTTAAARVLDVVDNRQPKPKKWQR